MMAIIVSSCMPEGREGLPTIETTDSQGGQSRFCTKRTTEDAIFSANTGICFEQCPEGLVPASSAEINELRQDIAGLENNDETKSFLNEMIDNAVDVCVAEKVRRPDNNIFVRRDFCACLEGRPDIINDCESFCSSRTQSESRLFATVDVGPDVALNNELQNLHGWCNNEITGSDEVSPSCVIDLWSESGSETSLAVQTFPGSNRFEAELTSLQYNKTYVARIIEVVSGASSDSFQLRRYRRSSDDNDTSTPLRIMPVSQYTCLDRASNGCGQIDGTDELYLCANRSYFYFPANNQPPPIPAGEQSGFMVCHDLSQGQNDNELFPRLELRPQHMAMWDLADIRFADLSNDGRPDIHGLIEDRLRDDFNINQSVNLFFPLAYFHWPNPVSGPQPNNLGFAMTPWIDPQTNRAYCPGREHYESSSPLFNILGELVGVDTEGLFMGVRQEGTGNPSIIFIRENLLRRIWFYYKNGQHYEPDSITAGQETIRFYWPPDVVDPYQQKAYQRIFTIRSPNNISGEVETGIPDRVSSHDKRVACIPALD